MSLHKQITRSMMIRQQAMRVVEETRRLEEQRKRGNLTNPLNPLSPLSPLNIATDPVGIYDSNCRSSHNHDSYNDSSSSDNSSNCD